MHRVVFEEPYEFIPPHHGRLWPRVIMAMFPRAMRKRYGIVDVKVEGAQKIRESINAGHGILLASNHCRPSDPFIMGQLFNAAKTLAYGMVSWHVFKQSAWDGFLVKKLGCFSIFREGADRASMVMAITVLKEAKRPLALFPEGVLTRSNDQLEGLMKGTGFIARQAAIMRGKEVGGGGGDESKVVIHPIGIHYVFADGQAAGVIAIEKACDDLEAMMELSPSQNIDYRERVGRLLHGLLGVMEAKHLDEGHGELAGELGHVADNAWYDRKDALIEAMLNSTEREYLGEPQEGDAVSRVKMLRAAILPAMVAKKVDAAERKRRWGQLTDAYYAQELSHFHRGYLDEAAGQVRIERWIETIEGIEEMLTDQSRIMGHWRVEVRVGNAIEVPATRAKKGEAKDAMMVELKARMLDQLRG